MKFLKTLFITVILISVAGSLSAQSTQTITIRLLESQYKKWSKIIIADKNGTIDIVDVTPIHPDKLDEVQVAFTQVLDKYINEGFEIKTSNGGISAQQYISTYVLTREN